MNVFNIVYKHATKNFEISIGISIKKLKLEDKKGENTLEITQE